MSRLLINGFEQSWIDFECPTCKISNSVRLKEIVIGSNILCRGCHCTIRLVQKDSNFSRSMEKLKTLDMQLNNLNKVSHIKLKF